jgi:hypothetical protein
MRVSRAVAAVALTAGVLTGCSGGQEETDRFCTALDEGRTQASALAESLPEAGVTDVVRDRRALETAADRLEDLAEDVSTSTARSLDAAFDTFDTRLEQLTDTGTLDERRAGAQTAFAELDTELQNLSDSTGCTS